MTAPILLTPTDEPQWLGWRAEDITSTETAALFGVSPYETAYELWQRKRGAITREMPDSDLLRMGRLMEAPIAALAAERLSLTVEPFKQYARHGAEPRMGASFDYSILGGANIDPAAGLGLLECKRVLYTADGWERPEDGTDIGEAPVHIELQLQHQLEVSNRMYGYIAALMPGDKLAIIYRERDHVLGAEIRRRIAAFWASIAADEPPAPDYRRDAGTIARLYGYAEPGKVADWRVEAPTRALDLLAEYERLGKVVKEAQDARDAAKAELLTMVGEAEKVQTPLGTLSLPMVGETHVEYTRKAYRMFRFTPAKAPKTPKE